MDHDHTSFASSVIAESSKDEDRPIASAANSIAESDPLQSRQVNVVLLKDANFKRHYFNASQQPTNHRTFQQHDPLAFAVSMPVSVSASSSSLGVRRLQKPFLKLNDCAHFHYEAAVLGPLRVEFDSSEEESAENIAAYATSNAAAYRNALEDQTAAIVYAIRVTSNGVSWIIRRTFAEFCQFDLQLHRCVYNRCFSGLPELRDDRYANLNNSGLSHYHAIQRLLHQYMQRFSQIAGSLISCGPVLKWLELDNHGNHMLDVSDDSCMNTPAIAAAQVVKPYSAQAADELSLLVGEIISITDMPPSTESIWWRGKKEVKRDSSTRRPSVNDNELSSSVEKNAMDKSVKSFAGFQVGFFPSSCVELFGTKKLPSIMSNEMLKPVFQRRGKLVTMFRTFLASRPTRRRLKETGILKERVFGCDLAEYLQNTGQDVPLILKSCSRMIETHGIVNGIYRLSGIVSNIQRLRNAFDENREPNLLHESILQDIHCVASVLKMYFRELPNPLFTYSLYNKFVSAVDGADRTANIVKLHEVVQQLPPPNYRTAEYLIRHLANVAEHGGKTSMTFQNLAIVWSPNLFRCKELEYTRDSTGGILRNVTIQAVLTEYLIRYVDIIFNHKFPAFGSNSGDSITSRRRNRPRSLAVSTPSRLINLDEAQQKLISARYQKVPLTAGLPDLTGRKCIDVNGGPAAIPMFHTVIEIPPKGRRSKKGGGGPLKVFLFRGKRQQPTADAASPTAKENRPPHASASLFAKSGGGGWSSAAARRYASSNVGGSRPVSNESGGSQSKALRPLISHHGSVSEATAAMLRHQPQLRSVRSAESLVLVGTGGSQRNSRLLGASKAPVVTGSESENHVAKVITIEKNFAYGLLSPSDEPDDETMSPLSSPEFNAGRQQNANNRLASHPHHHYSNGGQMSDEENDYLPRVQRPVLLTAAESFRSSPPAKLKLLETDMDAVEMRRGDGASNNSNNNGNAYNILSSSLLLPPSRGSGANAVVMGTRALSGERWLPPSPIFLSHSCLGEDLAGIDAQQACGIGGEPNSRSPISEPGCIRIQHFENYPSSFTGDLSNGLGHHHFVQQPVNGNFNTLRSSDEAEVGYVRPTKVARRVCAFSAEQASSNENEVQCIGDEALIMARSDRVNLPRVAYSVPNVSTADAATMELLEDVANSSFTTTTDESPYFEEDYGPSNRSYYRVLAPQHQLSTDASGDVRSTNSQLMLLTPLSDDSMNNDNTYYFGQYAGDASELNSSIEHCLGTTALDNTTDWYLLSSSAIPTEYTGHLHDENEQTPRNYLPSPTYPMHRPDSTDENQILHACEEYSAAYGPSYNEGDSSYFDCTAGDFSQRFTSTFGGNSVYETPKTPPCSPTNGEMTQASCQNYSRKHAEMDSSKHLQVQKQLNFSSGQNDSDRLPAVVALRQRHASSDAPEFPTASLFAASSGFSTLPSRGRPKTTVEGMSEEHLLAELKRSEPSAASVDDVKYLPPELQQIYRSMSDGLNGREPPALPPSPIESAGAATLSGEQEACAMQISPAGSVGESQRVKCEVQLNVSHRPLSESAVPLNKCQGPPDLVDKVRNEDSSIGGAVLLPKGLSWEQSNSLKRASTLLHPDFATANSVLNDLYAQKCSKQTQQSLSKTEVADSSEHSSLSKLKLAKQPSVYENSAVKPELSLPAVEKVELLGKQPTLFESAPSYLSSPPPESSSIPPEARVSVEKHSDKLASSRRSSRLDEIHSMLLLASGDSPTACSGVAEAMKSAISCDHTALTSLALKSSPRQDEVSSDTIGDISSSSEHLLDEAMKALCSATEACLSSGNIDEVLHSSSASTIPSASCQHLPEEGSISRATASKRISNAIAVFEQQRKERDATSAMDALNVSKHQPKLSFNGRRKCSPPEASSPMAIESPQGSNASSTASSCSSSATTSSSDRDYVTVMESLNGSPLAKAKHATTGQHLLKQHASGLERNASISPVSVEEGVVLFESPLFKKQREALLKSDANKPESEKSVVTATPLSSSDVVPEVKKPTLPTTDSATDDSAPSSPIKKRLSANKPVPAPRQRRLNYTRSSSSEHSQEESNSTSSDIVVVCEEEKECDVVRNGSRAAIVGRVASLTVPNAKVMQPQDVGVKSAESNAKQDLCKASDAIETSFPSQYSSPINVTVDSGNTLSALNQQSIATAKKNVQVYFL